jgi:hypothetical protein
VVRRSKGLGGGHGHSLGRRSQEWWEFCVLYYLYYVLGSARLLVESDETEEC